MSDMLCPLYMRLWQRLSCLFMGSMVRDSLLWLCKHREVSRSNSEFVDSQKARNARKLGCTNKCMCMMTGNQYMSLLHGYRHTCFHTDWHNCELCSLEPLSMSSMCMVTTAVCVLWSGSRWSGLEPAVPDLSAVGAAPAQRRLAGQGG